jgi:hypothetical protein
VKKKNTYANQSQELLYILEEEDNSRIKSMYIPPDSLMIDPPDPFKLKTGKE